MPSSVWNRSPRFDALGQLLRWPSAGRRRAGSRTRPGTPARVEPTAPNTRSPRCVTDDPRCPRLSHPTPGIRTSGCRSKSRLGRSGRGGGVGRRVGGTGATSTARRAGGRGRPGRRCCRPPGRPWPGAPRARPGGPCGTGRRPRHAPVALTRRSTATSSGDVDHDDGAQAAPARLHEQGHVEDDHLVRCPARPRSDGSSPRRRPGGRSRSASLSASGSLNTMSARAWRASVPSGGQDARAEAIDDGGQDRLARALQLTGDRVGVDDDRARARRAASTPSSSPPRCHPSARPGSRERHGSNHASIMPREAPATRHREARPSEAKAVPSHQPDPTS